MWRKSLCITLMTGIGLQCARAPARGDDQPPLDISLAFDQNTYLVEEPVAATVTLMNVTTRPVHLCPELDLSTGFLGIEYLTPSGASVRYKPKVTADLLFRDKDPGRVLPPGDSFSQRLNLTRTMDQGNAVVCTLQDAGAYTFRASYEFKLSPERLPDLQMPRVVSKPVALRVIAPEGKDAQAHQLLIRTKIRSVWGLSRDQQSAYEAILAQYPDSTYAKYALWYLAQCHRVQCELHGEKALGEKVVLEYQKILVTYPDFPFKDSVYLGIGTFYLNQRRYEEARQAFQRLMELIPVTSVQLKAQGWLSVIDERERKKP